MRKMLVLSLLLLLVFSATTLAQDGDRQLRITFSWPTAIDPAAGDDFSSSHALINLYDTLGFPDKCNLGWRNPGKSPRTT